MRFFVASSTASSFSRSSFASSCASRCFFSSSIWSSIASVCCWTSFSAWEMYQFTHSFSSDKRSLAASSPPFFAPEPLPFLELLPPLYCKPPPNAGISISPEPPPLSIFLVSSAVYTFAPRDRLTIVGKPPPAMNALPLSTMSSGCFPSPPSSFTIAAPPSKFFVPLALSCGITPFVTTLNVIVFPSGTALTAPERDSTAVCASGAFVSNSVCFCSGISSTATLYSPRNDKSQPGSDCASDSKTPANASFVIPRTSANFSNCAYESMFHLKAPPTSSRLAIREPFSSLISAMPSFMPPAASMNLSFRFHAPFSASENTSPHPVWIYSKRPLQFPSKDAIISGDAKSFMPSWNAAEPYFALSAAFAISLNAFA